MTTISAADASGGVITFDPFPGDYILPDTGDLFVETIDSSSTSFTGTPRHFITLTFYNASGGLCNVAAGAGQTFTVGESPMAIGDGATRTITIIFTSPTTAIIEDASTNNVSLSNAGTESLVNDGAGPSLATKGLVNGTAISFSSSATDVTITNTGVTSLTGTSNQITVSSSTGAVTLSLPNSVTITTSLTISGLTANAFLYSGTGGLLTTTAAPTNGQLLIGRTGLAPVLGTLTPGTGVSITNGAGSITIANTGVTSLAAGTAISVSASTGAITVTNTGVTSLTASFGTSVSAATGAVTISASQPLLTGTSRSIIGVLNSYTYANNNTSISGGSNTGALSGAGSVAIGGASNNTTISGSSTGAAAIGGNSVTTNLNSTNVCMGGKTCSYTANAVNSHFFGGNASTATSTLNGAIIGGSHTTLSLGGAQLGVIVGGQNLSATVSASSLHVLGGSACSTAFSGAVSAASVGGVSNTLTVSGTGPVIVGGNTIGGSSSGSGCVVVGGSSTTMAVTGNGTVACGGSTGLTVNGGVAGGVYLGGVSSSFTTSSGAGSCVIVGSSNGTSLSIVGAGTAAINARCVVGSVTGNSDNVVIGKCGGATLLGTGNVMLGPGDTTDPPAAGTVQTYNPSDSQLFYKHNAVMCWLRSSFTASTTLTPDQLINGYATMTAAVATAFTLPTAATLYTTAVDSASGFALNMTFFFILHNLGTANVTITGNTGLTLAGTTGAIAAGSARMGHVTFAGSAAAFVFLFF